jgi:hypothetical protein
MRVNPEWVGLGDRTPEQYAAEVLDAAVAEAAALAARPALDVERLRKALRRTYKSRYHERFAEPLAAEYARLAPGTEEEGR